MQKERMFPLIYLDNSATTKPSESAVKASIRMMEEEFGNPSSRYTLGLSSERILNEARASVAASLHTNAKNIIFTSGGTESDNLAIIGGANIKAGKRIVTTAIEHDAVKNAFMHLEALGFEVVFVAPEEDGSVKAEKILAAVSDKTSLVSVMHVNNETGAILPIEKLAPMIKRKAPRALFHVDAVQSYGKIDLSPSRWGIDLMTVSSHKVHGPKGVGALYKSDKVTSLKPIVFGGGQEGNIRSGTENMVGIAGFGAAAAEINPDEHYERMAKLKKDFAEKLLALPDVYLNGGLINSSPYILNVSFKGIRSEIMLNALSEEGIYVSSGSACAKGAKGSSTLAAMNVPYPDNAIRFSFSKHTSAEELYITYQTIIKKLEILR